MSARTEAVAEALGRYTASLLNDNHEQAAHYRAKILELIEMRDLALDRAVSALKVAEPYLGKMVADEVNTVVPPSRPWGIVKQVIADSEN